MNIHDKRLADAFKVLRKARCSPADQAKANGVIQQLQGRSGESDFQQLLTACFEALVGFNDKNRHLAATDYLRLINGLHKRMFTLSAEAFFLGTVDVLRAVELNTILLMAPTANAIDAWLKASKTKKCELELRLLQNPAASLATAGFDWCFVKGNIQKLQVLLDLLLSSPTRPSHLSICEELLAIIIEEDYKGKILELALSRYNATDDRLGFLIRVITGRQDLLIAVVDRLPALLCRKSVSAKSPEFVSMLFRFVLATRGEDRRFASASLARLATGVLLECPEMESKAILMSIEELEAQLRLHTRDEAVLPSTWLFECMGMIHLKQTVGEAAVSRHSLRQVAIAFENAQRGFTAEDVVTMLAKNLGLVPFEHAGTRVKYDPLRHEDIKGGLIPGDSVKVLKSGWTFHDGVAIRAKVQGTICDS